MDSVIPSQCLCGCCIQHLKRQQDGLSHLINIIKDDLEDLRIIEQGLVDASKLKQK